MGSRLDDITTWLLIRPCEVLNCCWESSQSLLKVAELQLFAEDGQIVKPGEKKKRNNKEKSTRKRKH